MEINISQLKLLKKYLENFIITGIRIRIRPFQETDLQATYLFKHLLHLVTQHPTG